MGVYKGLKGSFLLYLLSCRFGGGGVGGRRRIRRGAEKGAGVRRDGRANMLKW